MTLASANLAFVSPVIAPNTVCSKRPTAVVYETGSFRSVNATPGEIARNLIERFFNKIKQCRRVATRYDKLAANYLAFVKLASIRVWLRANESAP